MFHLLKVLWIVQKYTHQSEHVVVSMMKILEIIYGIICDCLPPHCALN